MNYLLQELIKRKRTEKNIKLSYLARLLGYKNISKGCRKLLEFENNKLNLSQEYIQKIKEILQISDYDLYLFENYSNKKQDISENNIAQNTFYITKDPLFSENTILLKPNNKFQKIDLPENAKYDNEEAIKFVKKYLKKKKNFDIKVGWLFLKNEKVINCAKGKIVLEVNLT